MQGWKGGAFVITDTPGISAWYRPEIMHSALYEHSLVYPDCSAKEAFAFTELRESVAEPVEEEGALAEPPAQTWHMEGLVVRDKLLWSRIGLAEVFSQKMNVQTLWESIWAICVFCEGSAFQNKP